MRRGTAWAAVGVVALATVVAGCGDKAGHKNNSASVSRDGAATTFQSASGNTGAAVAPAPQLAGTAGASTAGAPSFAVPPGGPAIVRSGSVSVEIGRGRF